MDQTLIDAITQRQLLCFYYENLLREVEPHAYGVTPKGGEVLRACQTGGQTKSGKVPCWRLFEVDLIQHLYLAGKTFATPRPGFKRNDEGMERIFAQV